MPRFVALLRGVSPSNASSAELRRAFERAGFERVKTVLASGNVAFDAPPTGPAELQQQAESALQATLGRSFPAIVRPVAHLQALVAGDPFAGLGVPAQAKRVVSFLREPQMPRVALPLAADDACVLHQVGLEAFTAYLPHPKGAVFMVLIERAFGTAVTTRTWDTVRRCATA